MNDWILDFEVGLASGPQLYIKLEHILPDVTSPSVRDSGTKKNAINEERKKSLCQLMLAL